MLDYLKEGGVEGRAQSQTVEITHKSAVPVEKVMLASGMVRCIQLLWFAPAVDQAAQFMSHTCACTKYGSAHVVLQAAVDGERSSAKCITVQHCQPAR